MCAMVEVTDNGVFSDCVEGFTDYLVGLGYAPSTVVLRINLLRHFIRWVNADGADPALCDEAVIERYMVDRQASHVDISSFREVAPLWAYLRLAGVIPNPAPLPVTVPGPVDAVLLRWCGYLSAEQGLKESSVRYYRGYACPLLESRLCEGCLDLDGLDAKAVNTFVLEYVTGLSVGVAHLAVTSLRSLLRFLFLEGSIRERLDQVVTGRSGYRDSGLPRGVTTDQLELLLAGIDTSRAVGKRNLAVILLLARMGLRAHEVAALCLEDIDWRAGTVRVLGKGNQIDLMPLPTDVGMALAGHLSMGRHPAATGRELFFGSRAPYLPLSNVGVRGIVMNAGLRAGIGTIGPHSLRHTVATRTINAGASLEEVAQLLRHRHLSSTTIYAKVDLSRLRTLAKPWPGVKPAAGTAACDEQA